MEEARPVQPRDRYVPEQPPAETYSVSMEEVRPVQPGMDVPNNLRQDLFLLQWKKPDLFNRGIDNVRSNLR